MNIQDVKHVSNAYVNNQDLSVLMTSEDIRKIKKVYASIGVSKTTLQLKKLAFPQSSGNAKRIMWFYFAKNGFIKIPPKHYCEIAQTAYKKDINLKGVYVRRCDCGKRPHYDRIEGYSCWIACNCGMKGHNDRDLDKAIKNWNSRVVYYDW